MGAADRDGVRCACREGDHRDIVYTLWVCSAITAADKDRDALRRQRAQTAIDRSLFGSAEHELAGAIANAEHLDAMIGGYAVQDIHECLSEWNVVEAGLVNENLCLRSQGRC